MFDNFEWNRQTILLIILGVIFLFVFLPSFMSSGGCAEMTSCVQGGVPR